MNLAGARGVKIGETTKALKNKLTERSSNSVSDQILTTHAKALT